MYNGVQYRSFIGEPFFLPQISETLRGAVPIGYQPERGNMTLLRKLGSYQPVYKLLYSTCWVFAQGNASVNLGFSINIYTLKRNKTIYFYYLVFLGYMIII
jgi:hypothetical protein